MAMKKLTKQVDDDTLIEFTNKGDSLEGYYVGTRQFTSKAGNDITKHVFRNDDGELISCFGSTMLNEDIKSVEPGVRVRVTYEGKATSKKGRKFNNFTIEVDTDDRVSA